jgi:hypothetical protein
LGKLLPQPPTAAGAIVMAIGIFGAAALQRIPDAASDLTKAIAAIAALLWLAIAAVLLLCAAREGMAIHTSSLARISHTMQLCCGGAERGEHLGVARPALAR